MGRDKRLLIYSGMTLLDRVCLLAETVTGKRPVLVGDNLPLIYRSRYQTIPDALPNKGPLAGLVAALEHNTCPWSLILPVDMPGLREEVIEGLFSVLGENVEAAALSGNNFIEPLAAVYRTNCASFWRNRLELGELSLIKGMYLLKHRACDVNNYREVLINLNRPADFTPLLRRSVV